MTIIASLSDIEPIISGLQTQIAALQTTANAAGAPPNMQNGVVSSTDAVMTGISVDGYTGDLTFSFGGATAPIYIVNNQGVLVPVSFNALTGTSSPPTLPPSGESVCVGIEVDTGGAMYLVCGPSAAGNQPILSLTTPATAVGRLRLADFAVANVGGVYQLASTTATDQGVNWLDRRPWALGIDTYTEYNLGASTISATNTTLLQIVTGFQLRIECTGRLMEVRLYGASQSNSSSGGWSGFGILLDGVESAARSGEYNTTNVGYWIPLEETFEILPPAGSHLITPAWVQTSGNTGSIEAVSVANSDGGTGVLYMSVRERGTQANNGSS